MSRHLPYKHLILLILSLLNLSFLTDVSAQVPALHWGQLAGHCDIEAITADHDGNVITAGNFNSEMEMISGGNSFRLLPLGNRDVFIFKTDSNGKVLWVRQLGGKEGSGYGGADIRVNAVSTDAEGYIRITGAFTGNIDFDPGTDSLFLNSTKADDIFICQLDTAGNLVSAISFPAAKGKGDDQGLAIKSLADGGMIVAGEFMGSVDFDPGESSEILTSEGKKDLFVIRMDQSGKLIWARHSGTTLEAGECELAIDEKGNSIVSGVITGFAGNQDGKAEKVRKLMLMKLSPEGKQLWKKEFDIPVYGKTAVAADADGNIYAGGTFRGDAQIAGTAISSGLAEDAFIFKLNPAGEYQWIKTSGTDVPDGASALAIGTDGRIFLAGYFHRDYNFNASGQIISSYAGSRDVFIAEFNPQGRLSHIAGMGGTRFDLIRDLHSDSKGNLYLAGKFTHVYDIDPAPSVHYLQSDPQHAASVFIKLGDEKTYRDISIVHFDSDRDELKLSGKKVIDSLLSAIHPAGILQIDLVGHTDYEGDTLYNLELSRKRALAVKQYLLSHPGLTANQILLSYYGERIPLTEERNDAAKSLNRRVEIVITYQKPAGQNAASLRTDIPHRPLILKGFEKEGKTETISSEMPAISLHLEEHILDMQQSVFWASVRTGSTPEFRCEIFNPCLTYQVTEDGLILQSFIKTPYGKGKKELPSRCMNAPAVVCDWDKQPEEHRILIKRHTDALMDDEKIIRTEGNTLYLISKNGSKETLIYEFR